MPMTEPDCALPTGVKPTGDDGVYSVDSFTSQQVYRCDVTNFTCNCGRATKGLTAQTRNRLGYLPYDATCKHVRRAIAYDGMLLRMEKMMGPF